MRNEYFFIYKKTSILIFPFVFGLFFLLSKGMGDSNLLSGLTENLLIGIATIAWGIIPGVLTTLWTLFFQGLFSNFSGDEIPLLLNCMSPLIVLSLVRLRHLPLTGLSYILGALAMFLLSLAFQSLSYTLELIRMFSSFPPNQFTALLRSGIENNLEPGAFLMLAGNTIILLTAARLTITAKRNFTSLKG